MKSIIALSLFMVLSLIKLYGDDAKELSPQSVDSIRVAAINNIKAYYNNLDLEYQVNITHVLIHPQKDQNPNQSTTIDYRGQYPYFDLKVKQSDGSGNDTTVVREAAYDGKYVQYLSGTGRLDLSTMKPGFDDSSICLLGTRNPALFAPFWFINPEVVRNPYYIDHPWNLEKLVSSNKGLSNFTVLGTQLIDTIPCVAILLPKGSEYKSSTNPGLPGFPVFPNDVEVKAYLNDKMNYYPMKWDLISKSRGILVEYEIKQLDSFTDKAGKIRYFPAKAVMTDWGSMSSVNSSKPSVWNVEVNSVSVLPAKSDGSDYTIDPGLASAIFDDDKHIEITVPK